MVLLLSSFHCIYRQCTEALGGRDLKEVQQLVKAGTLTEEDLR